METCRKCLRLKKVSIWGGNRYQVASVVVLYCSSPSHPSDEPSLSICARGLHKQERRPHNLLYTWSLPGNPFHPLEHPACDGRSPAGSPMSCASIQSLRLALRITPVLSTWGSKTVGALAGDPEHQSRLSPRGGRSIDCRGEAGGKEESQTALLSKHKERIDYFKGPASMVRSHIPLLWIRHRCSGFPSLLFADYYRHAGMPNPTNETRIMLAIVYYAA